MITKVFLFAVETRWDLWMTFFFQEAFYNNYFLQLNRLPSYSQYKQNSLIIREIRGQLDSGARKRFKYIFYPLGWNVFENYFLIAQFVSIAGTTKMVVTILR